MSDLFTFSSSALPDDATLLDFRLREELNVPFELFVHFRTTSPDDIDLADAIGAKAKLVADRGEGGPSMQWAGLIAAIEHIQQMDEVGIFRCLVVPPVWYLAHGEHSRVFTQKSVKDVVTDVLTDAGARLDRLRIPARGLTRPRGAHHPISRERSHVHPSLARARGQLLLLRARRRGREDGPHRSKSLGLAPRRCRACLTTRRSVTT